MTEDERKAMEWLDDAIHRDAKWESVGDEMHRATLKAMLARPVMPEEPSEETARALMDRGEVTIATGHRRYRALYAHLTAPNTKEVEVWRVEWAWRRDDGAWLLTKYEHPERSEVERQFALCESNKENCALARITGPHKQTVPA